MKKDKRIRNGLRPLFRPVSLTDFNNVYMNY